MTAVVSIIVPCYKVEEYLKNCIESVRRQTYTNWELILVDDGSPDECGKICDAYSKEDKRIISIHIENSGAAAARNVGIEVASGGYLCFLDGDDFLQINYLSDMLKLIKGYNADIAQCAFIHGESKVFPVYRGKEKVLVFSSHDLFVKDYAKIIVCGKLYKTHIIKKYLIPEKCYYEDDRITWKWYEEAERIVVTNKPYYYYTKNDNSTMSAHIKKLKLDFFDLYDEKIKYYSKKGDKDVVDSTYRFMCKSYLLAYDNSSLNKDEKKMLYDEFYKCWLQIKDSKLLSPSLHILFYFFNKFPYLTSNIVNLIYRKILNH